MNFKLLIKAFLMLPLLSISLSSCDKIDDVVDSIKGDKADVKSGLYAHFPMNGNLDNVTKNDIVSYCNPELTFVDGPVSDSKAASFSKSDKSSFIVSEGLVDGEQTSVAFWVKDISEGRIFHVVSSDKGDSRDGVMMRFDFVGGHIKYIIDRYRINYRYEDSGNFSHTKINDDKWHHIALVTEYFSKGLSYAIVKLYVDGKLMDTLNMDYIEQDMSHHFNTGVRFVMGGENVPNMKIANLRVYNSRCLGDADVKELYEKKL